MLYKCDHCNYSSNRLSNLVRHQNKLFPCNNTSKVKVCKKKDEQNVVNPINVVCQNVNDLGQKVNDLSQQVNAVCQNVNETNNSVDDTTNC